MKHMEITKTMWIRESIIIQPELGRCIMSCRLIVRQTNIYSYGIDSPLDCQEWKSWVGCLTDRQLKEEGVYIYIYIL